MSDYPNPNEFTADKVIQAFLDSMDECLSEEDLRRVKIRTFGLLNIPIPAEEKDS